MIRSTIFNGKTVAVFGLGASGTATVRSLLEGGAHVAAWDDSAAGRDAAAAAGVPIVDLGNANWREFSALVLAPGVPLTHPDPHWTVTKARAAGIEIIGDIELFTREREKVCPRSPFLAITGTNGKSTTTALIAHLLREMGLDVQLGGNIGRAILTLEPSARDRFHVIEMSSFQIDLTPTLKPTVGILLNITPDHIDRHGTVENYAAVKARLVLGANAACIGMDDEWTRDIAAKIVAPPRLYPFALDRNLAPGSYFASGDASIVSSEQIDGQVPQRTLVNLAGVGSLRGTHNLQNALAALTALRALQDQLDADGSPTSVWRPGQFQQLFATFPGLPHRMEEAGRSGNVLFINDSKATNADSTGKALASWPGGIFWIAGGKPKEGGIASLAPYFERVCKAYLIGEASDEFAATLAGKVAFERCGTLEIAVSAAARDAGLNAGMDPVVLLSPACASYDQFKNFEVRGDTFRNLVRALPGVQIEPGGA